MGPVAVNSKSPKSGQQTRGCCYFLCGTRPAARSLDCAHKKVVEFSTQSQPNLVPMWACHRPTLAHSGYKLAVQQPFRYETLIQDFLKTTGNYFLPKAAKFSPSLSEAAGFVEFKATPAVHYQ